MSVLTNCKNCGAPLRDMRCDYCSTDYRQPYERMPRQNIKIYHTGTKTVAALIAIPRDELKHGDSRLLEQRAKRNVINNLVEQVANYIDFDTWENPETQEIMYGARLKIVEDRE